MGYYIRALIVPIILPTAALGLATLPLSSAGIVQLGRGDPVVKPFRTMASFDSLASGDVRLYEVFPKRLRLALALTVICFVVYPLVGIVFKSVSWVAPILVALTCFTIFLTVVNFLRLFGLTRPALMLGDVGINYRNLEVPWSIISSATLIQTEDGVCLGIKVTDRSKIYVRNAPMGRRALLRAAERSFDRYGALIVPPMRHVELDELQLLVTERAKHRTS